jgi:hypothetical protein
MTDAISNGVIIDEERPGWCLSCPRCAETVLYTKLNVSGGREPFLYCDKCSDFVLREEDAELVWKRFGDTFATTDQMREIYLDIEGRLPACHCGGRFTTWSNVTCRSCGYQFPYNSGIRSEEVRFFDSSIVWIEGAVAYRGLRAPSNRLVKVYPRNLYGTEEIEDWLAGRIKRLK